MSVTDPPDTTLVALALTVTVTSGSGFTVSVAMFEYTVCGDDDESVTLIRYWWPFIEVSAVTVVPQLVSLSVYGPSFVCHEPDEDVLYCHVCVYGAVPPDHEASKETSVPALTDTDCGCDVISRGSVTVTVTLLLVALFVPLVTTQ